ncbi:zincin-like metallopeptidase domain-containing protein (plasmid) [Ensifer sp. D2-11]
MERAAVIQHQGDRACYIPALDLIKMPPFSAFESPEAYYSTLFHETAHNADIQVMPAPVPVNWKTVASGSKVSA